MVIIPVMWIRIQINVGSWIRNQGYKMKDKAEFNQQRFIFVGNYIF